MAKDLDLELKAFIEAMKKNGCPMWMFERDEDGNFEDMTMAHSWYAWQEKAKAQAVPETHIVVPRTREVVVAIEKMVEQQVEASGITSDVFRLDGWRILDAIQEASESGAEG